MHKGGRPPEYNPNNKKTRNILRKCTCGRAMQDYGDLAVIIESDKTEQAYGIEYKTCLVVCLRKGCVGAWRSSKKITEKHPRMLSVQYNQIKAEQKHEMEVEKLDSTHEDAREFVKKLLLVWLLGKEEGKGYDSIIDQCADLMKGRDIRLRGEWEDGKNDKPGQ